MDKPEFLKQLHKLGLQHLAQAAVRHAKQCIYISTETTDKNLIQIAASKFGGLPDVPEDFIWPSWQGTRLAFLGQINLADVSEFLPEENLPEDGLFSVFYHPDQTTWGFDPKDQGSWKTYHFPSNATLLRRNYPDLNSKFLDGPYRPCSLIFEAGLSYPDPFSEQLKKIYLTESEIDIYGDLYEASARSPVHQIFGYPNVIQDSMEIQCQLVTNGIYCGDANWSKHPRYQELIEGADDWKMLLQIDSDDNTGMMWGDLGMLYFWIRKDSLSKQNLEDTWMIFQCS